MRILITAGGTSEKIDQVRSVTNHSTGQLGVTLAKEALAKGNLTIDYLVAKGAVLPPKDPRITLHFIESSQELADKMAELLASHPYVGVIHCMAVSDFTPEVSVSEEAFLNQFNLWQQHHPQTELTSESLQEIINQLAENTKEENKLSSKTPHLLVIMKQTQKIIAMIKAQQPETILVGFKLLVAVSDEELLQVAQTNLLKNQADYVLANDLSSIHDGQHRGILIDQKGVVGEAFSKPAIAQLILTTLLQKLAERN